MNDEAAKEYATPISLAIVPAYVVVAIYKTGSPDHYQDHHYCMYIFSTTSRGHEKDREMADRMKSTI